MSLTFDTSDNNLEFIDTDHLINEKNTPKNKGTKLIKTMTVESNATKKLCQKNIIT